MVDVCELMCVGGSEVDNEDVYVRVRVSEHTPRVRHNSSTTERMRVSASSVALDQQPAQAP